MQLFQYELATARTNERDIEVVTVIKSKVHRIIKLSAVRIWRMNKTSRAGTC